MKEKYYRELGLEPGASEKEIKRAYFKLVRQFSPEKDPERFRQIREAYEGLQAASEETGPSFAEPSDPFAKKMLEQIWEYQKAGDLVMYKKACEEAYRYFPDETVFLYMMVQAQRRSGNTGKAVRNAELLVKREADNKWFWRELAISYSERGYTKKAFGAFEKAYSLGCRENDFILMYAVLCNDYGEYETGIRILSEMLGSDQKWTAGNFEEALEAFAGIVNLNIKVQGNYFAEAIDKMLAILKSNPILVNDSVRELSMVLFMMISLSEVLSEKERNKINEFLLLLDSKKNSPEVKEVVDQCRKELAFRMIEQDERLCETLKAGADAFLFMEEDDRARRYAIADIKLCMLKEKKEILSQIDIIEKEYPEYYKAIEDFIQKLRKDDVEYLKSRLLKEYVRMNEEFEDGIYFKKYPEEKVRSMGTLLYDGDNDTPYVRTNKKIGRNDPCPCGSGKKYKQCCGR